MVQNNQILDTIYPHSNFLQHQLFTTDEERKKINEGAGDYQATRSCWLKTKNRDEFWYVPLWSYFRAGCIPCLYPKDELQIRSAGGGANIASLSYPLGFAISNVYVVSTTNQSIKL